MSTYEYQVFQGCLMGRFDERVYKQEEQVGSGPWNRGRHEGDAIAKLQEVEVEGSKVGNKRSLFDNFDGFVEGTKRRIQGYKYGVTSNQHKV